MTIVRATTGAGSPDLPDQREAVYRELPRFSMKRLRTALDDALTREPRVTSVPHTWRGNDVRPRMLRAGELVTAELRHRQPKLCSAEGF